MLPRLKALFYKACRACPLVDTRVFISGAFICMPLRVVLLFVRLITPLMSSFFLGVPMSDDADDFVNPFGRVRATHTLCAGCQRVLPSSLFKAKSSLGQAVARGMKRPYETTSKYCKD